jgi:large subunit ribosomal protein L18
MPPDNRRKSIVQKNQLLNVRRQRRRHHTRRRVRGSAERPRLTVYRSHQNVACQIIDDVAGRTLVSASTQDAAIRAQVAYGGNKTAAQAIGKAIAEKALAAGIKEVCFDRGHYKYHGRIAALADAAREAGLSF